MVYLSRNMYVPHQSQLLHEAQKKQISKKNTADAMYNRNSIFAIEPTIAEIISATTLVTMAQLGIIAQ